MSERSEPRVAWEVDGATILVDGQPTGGTIGIEIPVRVKQALGLNDAPTWVIVSEHNIDGWPNGGLSPVRPGVIAYGFIPPKLFRQIKSSLLELTRRTASTSVRRE